MAKAGRKSDYDTKILPNFDVIRELASKGLTEKEIYQYIGVTSSSWYKYKAQYKEFTELLNARIIDKGVIDEVRSALHRKATGFVYEDIDEVWETNEDGQTYLKQRKKHIINALPDTNAINLFLKNYDKENWSNDPQQLEIKKQELQMKKEELELKKKEFENNNW